MGDKYQTDTFGVRIEVGDIVYSAAKGSRGEIGRVEKIFPSGHITIKWPYKSNVYAYEQGAPDIPATGTRAKRNEDGTYVYDSHRGYRSMVYEEYEYLRKDYTVVGKKWSWRKTECAWFARVVLRKHDWSEREAFTQAMNLDYDADTPELD